MTHSDAVIDLPEWGGKRAVHFEKMAGGKMFGHALCFKDFYVGPLSEEAGNNNGPNWKPWESFRDDRADNSSNLYLTKDGPYIEVSDWQNGTGEKPQYSTFYRITDNRLIPVCSMTGVPYGYPVKNYKQKTSLLTTKN